MSGRLIEDSSRPPKRSRSYRVTSSIVRLLNTMMRLYYSGISRWQWSARADLRSSPGSPSTPARLRAIECHEKIDETSCAAARWVRRRDPRWSPYFDNAINNDLHDNCLCLFGTCKHIGSYCYRELISWECNCADYCVFQGLFGRSSRIFLLLTAFICGLLLWYKYYKSLQYKK